MSTTYSSDSRHEIPAIASRVGRLFRWSPLLPYRSKSAWEKKGRKLLPAAQPVGFVVNESGRTNGLTLEQFSKMYPAVLENCGKGWFIVVFNGYHVYAFEQTVAKTPRNRREKTRQQQKLTVSDINTEKQTKLSITSSSPCSSSPPSSSPSYDSGKEQEIDSKPCQDMEIRAVNNGAERIPKSRSVNSRKPRALEATHVYFPVGFDWDSYPKLKPHQAAVKYILHLLHLRRVLYDGERDAFIELKMAYLKAIVPEAPAVMKLLLDLNILERDTHYLPGEKSYGYRLVSDELRNAVRKKIPLNDTRLSKRLAAQRQQATKAPVHRWLRDQLYRIGLAEIDQEYLRQVAVVSQMDKNKGTVEDKIEAYRYALNMIQDGYYHAAADDYGRFHSNVTNLKRELRSVLRVSGRPLSEIDIKNSQLLFLALEMKKDGADCGDFLDRCQQDVYKYIANEANVTRDKVKKAITQRALFSENDKPCQRSPIKQTFDRLFPQVALYLHQAKDQKDGHKLLAQQLQQAESDFVVGTVCERIRREKRVTFITTIHDSVLFLPKDGEYIMQVMLDEFSKLGVTPRLEVKTLAPPRQQAQGE